MGKFSRNKVSPKEGKTIKDNWVKGKDQKKAPKKAFSKPKPDEPVKLARVKDDPFFVSEPSTNQKPSGSNQNNSWTTKNVNKSPRVNDGINKRRSLTSWKSKTNFFHKNNAVGDSNYEEHREEKRKSNFFQRNNEKSGGNDNNFAGNIQATNKKNRNSDGFQRKSGGNTDFFQKPSNTPVEQCSTLTKSNSKSFFNKSTVKNTNSTAGTSRADQKKPFDKKKWRMQKYSKRLKLDQWEEKRKKAILRNYFKDAKPNEKKFDVQKIYAENPSSDDEDGEGDDEDQMEVDNENNLNANIQSERELSNKSVEFVEEENDDEVELNNSKAKKGKAYKKAKLEYERIKNEKKQRKEELARRRKERDEALKIYKEKKVEKIKKLSRKTKKGQPIMKDQIEMLLEKIQKNVGQH